MKRALLTILLLALPSFSHADWRDKTLAQLVEEYRALPTLENEDLLENLMNNVMIQEALQASPETLGAKLEELNYSAAEITVIKKQRLTAEIMKQGILEIPEVWQLQQLLFFGIYQGTILKSVEKISDIETIFDILFLLLQREEEEIKEFALLVLTHQGPVYPSTDSFCRGLARYAAVSATNAEKFDRILKLLDELYEVLERHPKPSHESVRHYFVSQISGELTNTTYNPDFADLELRKKIIENLFVQFRKRAPDSTLTKGRVREDLLRSLVSISGNSEIDQMAQEIMETSTSDLELRATLLGLVSRPDQWGLKLIYHSLGRLQSLPTPANQTSLVGQAVQYFVYPFYSRASVTEELGLMLRELFKHPNPTVRRGTIEGLRWSGFDREFAQGQLLKFLSDESGSVRSRALGDISTYAPWDAIMKYLPRIKEIAEADPDDSVREYAAELVPELIERYNTTKARVEAKAAAKADCGEILKDSE